jgi:hypothetical protein
MLLVCLSYISELSIHDEYDISHSKNQFSPHWDGIVLMNMCSGARLPSYYLHPPFISFVLLAKSPKSPEPHLVSLYNESNNNSLPCVLKEIANKECGMCYNKVRPKIFGKPDVEAHT